MTFTAAQLETLRSEYTRIETVSIDRLGDVRAIFNGCDNATIEMLATAGIKFISKLAGNEKIRRGMTTTPAPMAGIYRSGKGSAARPFRVVR